MGLRSRLAWRAFESEIAAWGRAGRAPTLWWRDDDARGPSPMLDRLIGLSERHRAPVALAVIPDRDLAPLAAAIAGASLLTPIQHGCDHIDRGAADRSTEFAADTPAAMVADAIGAGWARLAGTLAPAPIYAPPWNVLTVNVAEALKATPLRAVSLYGEDAPAPPGLISLNAHIDIMRWRPACFRGQSEILRRLVRLLQGRRRGKRWEDPVGVLTHHRNLDPESWAFMEALLARAPAIAWSAVTQLVA